MVVAALLYPLPCIFLVLLGLLPSRIQDAVGTSPAGEIDHVGCVFYLSIPTQQNTLKFSDLKQEHLIFSHSSVYGLGSSSAGFNWAHTSDCLQLRAQWGWGLQEVLILKSGVWCSLFTMV